MATSVPMEDMVTAPEDTTGFDWRGGVVALRMSDSTVRGRQAVVDAACVDAVLEGPHGGSILHMSGGGTIKSSAAFAELYPHFVTFWKANRR